MGAVRKGWRCIQPPVPNCERQPCTATARGAQPHHAAVLIAFLATVLPAEWLELPVQRRTGAQAQIPRYAAKRGYAARTNGARR